MPKTIGSCVLVEPSSSIRQCMDTYGIEGEGPWVNNSISRDALFWSCGMISTGGQTTEHKHDPVEVKRCRSLASAASRTMGALWAMLRSGSDPETHPFFVAARSDTLVASRIDESLIRAMLGGSLHPDASVIIEPLAEGTAWWQDIEEDARNDPEYADPKSLKKVLKPWHKLMQWFPAQELAAPSFVQTTHPTHDDGTIGCVFPCFVVGISDKGSLVGIVTHVVS